MQQDVPHINQFLEGDPVILTQLYNQTFPAVTRYIIRHDGTKKDAEDIFQNALVLLYVKLKEKKLNIQSLDKYLFTVCRNMWRRERAKNRVTNLDIVPLVSEELDKAQFYIEQEQWELYKEKFGEISSSCQEILKMALQKISYEDIAARFQYASQAVARQRVFKCKTKLIKLIKSDNTYNSLKK